MGLVRTKKDIEREKREMELRFRIQDTISTEECWQIVIEALSNVLNREIQAYNRMKRDDIDEIIKQTRK